MFLCKPPFLPLASRRDVVVFKSDELKADLARARAILPLRALDWLTVRAAGGHRLAVRGALRVEVSPSPCIGARALTCARCPLASSAVDTDFTVKVRPWGRLAAAVRRAPSFCVLQLVDEYPPSADYPLGFASA